MTDRTEERKKYYVRNKRTEQMNNAVRTAKRRAMKQNVPFDLKIVDLDALGNRCAITGLEFRSTPWPGHPCPFSPSLDRIKPHIGYVKGNVRLILNGVNAMKGAGTDEDIKEIMKAMVKNGFLD